MEENVAVGSPASSIIPDSGIQTHIIEEGPRVCPLCSSEIRLFFIHFNEKMLMCENTECDYPFGYEDLQFVRVENDEEMSEGCSMLTRNRPNSPNGSVISTSGWSEIDKINQVYESEDSQCEPKPVKASTKKTKTNNRKVLSVRESEKRIQKNVEDLKDLSMELMEIDKRKKFINNEKWIKKLMHLQDQSGHQLLQPQELKKINKSESKNELKIDIEPGDSSCVSSIKIKIADQC